MADKFLTKGSEIRWNSNPSNNILYKDNDLIRFYTNKQSKYALVNDRNIRYKKQNIGNPSGPVEHINGEYRVRQFIYTKFTPDEIKPYLDKISSGELTINYPADLYSYIYPDQGCFDENNIEYYSRYTGLCIDRQSGILYGFPYKSGNMYIRIYSPISKKIVSKLNIKIIVGNPLTESEIGTKYFLLSPGLLTITNPQNHFKTSNIINMSLQDPDGRKLRCISTNAVDSNFFTDFTASKFGKNPYGGYSYVEKGSKFTISISFNHDLIEEYISKVMKAVPGRTREDALEYLFGNGYKGYGYFGIMSTNDKTKIPNLSDSKKYKEFIKKIHLNDVLIKELIMNNHKHILFEYGNNLPHYAWTTFYRYPPDNFDDDWENA